MYEVGKVYSVPTITIGKAYPWKDCNTLTISEYLGCKNGDMPLLMGIHADEPWIIADGRPNIKHAHIDYRFLSDDWYAKVMTKHGGLYGIGRPLDISMLFNDYQLEEAARVMPLVEKRILCRRPLPGTVRDDALTARLATDFKCARIIDGKCPHRGIKREAMVEIDGVLACPGHGLRWHKKTGRLVEGESR